MRPNLSLEHIAAAIAILGTSAVLAACTKAEKSSAAPASAASAIKADNPSQGAAATGAAPVEAKPESPPPVASASAAPAASDIKGLKRRPGGGSGGQASCGSGNCSAELKKK